MRGGEGRGRGRGKGDGDDGGDFGGVCWEELVVQRREGEA